MKKILAILLCAVMTLSIVACGTQKEGIPAQNSGVVSSSDESNSTTNMVSSDITNPSDNVLIGTWKCLTYDYLIYTFVNDTDLEVFSIDETIKYSYNLDGNRLTINEGDSSYSFDVQISGDRFSFVLDDVELVFEKDNSVKEEVSNSSSEGNDNPLIGTWVCQTNDSLIYTFVNDTDLEILDAGETIMYTYQFDGDNLSISDGDMLQITRMIVSEDGFTLCGDEILEFKNINGLNSESDNETNAGDSGENAEEKNTEESNGSELSASESQLVGTWECELNGGFYTRTYTFNSDRTGVIQDTSSGLTSQFDLWKYDGGVLYYESNFTYSDGSAGKDIGNLNINLNGKTFSCVNLWGEEEVYTKK